jgi:hypothetical protein
VTGGKEENMFGRSLRTGLAALVLTLTAVPAFAFADGNTKEPSRTEHVKEGKQKAQFPMAADKFREHVENRITKNREKIVERMNAKNVPAEKQEKVLAKFDEGTKTIMAEVDKVSASGTVTKEGAEQVRAVTQQVRGAHHKGHGKEARNHKDGDKNVGRKS